MLPSVGNGEIVYTQKQVVDGNLVEYFLGYCNGGSLVFNYHPGAKGAVVDHGVGTHDLFAHRELHLVGNQSGGVVLLADKQVDEVLAHPLLGSEGYPTAAKGVENHGAVAFAANFNVKRWQI